MSEKHIGLTEKTHSDKFDAKFEFINKDLFHVLCGPADGRVRELSEFLGVDLIPRGNLFHIKSESREKRDASLNFFNKISELYPENSKNFPEAFDLQYIFSEVNKSADISEKLIEKKSEDESGLDLLREKIFTTARGRPIYPRTIRQAEYIDSLKKNAITICKGPAGTGKTFLGIAQACSLFMQGEVERLILTRPAVEAGESLGFLPGDLSQKVDPYLRPVYDALYDCIGMEKVHDLISSRKIEIAPLAYMRGRTLNDAFIILDEAQNCTLPQLKMFLTRLGKNSRMCLGGDVTQVDLGPGRSGLEKSIEILSGLKGVGIVSFSRKDIVRNPIVEKILEAFDAVEDVGKL